MIKGRGAQKVNNHKFSEFSEEIRADFLEYLSKEDETSNIKTTFIPTFPKTIINKVPSPDVHMLYSLNAYQGCEHGCIYCFARNSHEYWGYNAGLDFESKILVKQNAVELLEAKFKSPQWKAIPIGMSGNTDCYQPIEKKLEITRSLLKIFLKYRHPVGIVTKNSLILRDLDIIKELASFNLVSVYLSITTLSEATRRLVEPRTATIKKRLQTLEELTKNGIPTSVMIAPIIPGINSHEILPVAKITSSLGARSLGFTVVRLNGAIGKIFTDWITEVLPDKKDKVLSLIKQCHQGNLNNSEFGLRKSGSGPVANQIHQQIAIARRKYFPNQKPIRLNCELHHQFKTGQLALF
ncbi:PA0069 family radical SAM protein [Aquimarina sp. ERC-38]|uniref:PA0069 family radical SAM protein n=1 Tax=Aquimarina sp. ERC-38 TaxID=2949996 RepID=UPI00224537FC|nr:PA0069 family radical SAM protein [Aquimarina sp. ERC-38]UZO81912.1 PA0069 family radical SAM protein [Aquimarina sp. ERC-38]